MGADAEILSEQEQEKRESQDRREDEAVEKLQEAEQRQVEKNLAAGREPLSNEDDKEIDRASETWHRLAVVVSSPEQPQDDDE